MARNVKIDIYRMIFCIMIVIYHSNKFFGDGVYFSKGWYIGVDFFFLLSGLFLMQSIEKLTDCGEREEGQMIFLRKVKNLYPLYIISYFVSFVVTQIVKHTGIKEMIKTLSRSVGKIFCLEMSGMSIRGGYALRGSWYLSAMLIATLVILALYFIGRHYFYYITAPMGVILFLGFFNQKYGMIHRTSDWLTVTYSGVIRAVGVMLLGCICYKLGKYLAEKKLTKRKLVLLNIVEVLAFLIVIVVSFYKAKSSFDFMYLVLCAVGITLAYGVTGACDNLACKRLAWIGKNLSYPIYLNHLWIIVLIQGGGVKLILEQKLSLFVVSLAVICALVMGIEKIIKTAFQKYLKMREKYLQGAAEQ